MSTHIRTLTMNHRLPDAKYNVKAADNIDLIFYVIISYHKSQNE